jgi:hypothetical protein
MNNRKLLLGAILTILLLMVLGSVSLLSHRGLVKITVVAIPHDSTITLDGTRIKEGPVYVKREDHTLKAERQYFTSITKKVAADKLSGTVYLLPDPSSWAALDWLKQHPEEQLEREAIGGTETQQTQDVLFKNNPVVEKLPVYNFRYRIDYSVVSGNTLKFTIHLYPSGDSGSSEYKDQAVQYKNEALNFLKDNGADPSKYTIEFIPNV